MPASAVRPALSEISVLFERQRDWVHKASDDTVMDIARERFGAHGVAVESASRGDDR